MHTRVTILVQKIYTNIFRSIYRVNCYLRQRVLACHVCLYQSASHPCIHNTSGKQCATSLQQKWQGREGGGLWNHYILFYDAFECFDCFGRKAIISPNPAYVCLFHHGHSSKLSYNFQDCPSQKLSMMCTHHGSGVPRIGQLTTDLLIRIPVHIHTT